MIVRSISSHRHQVDPNAGWRLTPLEQGGKPHGDERNPKHSSGGGCCPPGRLDLLAPVRHSHPIRPSIVPICHLEALRFRERVCCAPNASRQADWSKATPRTPPRRNGSRHPPARSWTAEPWRPWTRGGAPASSWDHQRSGCGNDATTINTQHTVPGPTGRSGPDGVSCQGRGIQPRTRATISTNDVMLCPNSGPPPIGGHVSLQGTLSDELGVEQSCPL
jgi:hypothetical protein